jgi:hypothetical protein
MPKPGASHPTTGTAVAPSANRLPSHSSVLVAISGAGNLSCRYLNSPTAVLIEFPVEGLFVLAGQFHSIDAGTAIVAGAGDLILQH